ncbi:MAG: glycosyltransferase [Candidatus Nezhaarchaeales archaeon]
MRLYVSVCGMGLGHASRCLALAEEARRRGHQVVFSTYRGEAASLIRSRGFAVYEAPGISYKLNREGDVDFRLTLARGPLEVRRLLTHVALELRHLSLFKPDVVISDSRLSTIIAARILDVPSALILNQLKVIIPRRRPIKGLALAMKRGVERLGCELLSEVWRLASKVFIPDFPPPLTISKANLEVPEGLRGKVRLTGPLLSEEVMQLGEVKDELRRGGHDPLVVASMGGLKEERLRLLKAVVLGLSRVRGLRALISAGLPGYDTKLLLRRGGVEVYGWIPNYWKLLAAADVCLSHGGHTSIAEAIYAATPMVLAPLRGHTERYNNSRSAEQLGVARVIDPEEAGPREIEKAVLEVLEDSSYARRAAAVAKMARRFHATKEVLDEVTKLA